MSKEQARVTCKGCGQKIDPNVCYCGNEIKEGGGHDNHYSVPMGCVCWRDPPIDLVAKSTDSHREVREVLERAVDRMQEQTIQIQALRETLFNALFCREYGYSPPLNADLIEGLKKGGVKEPLAAMEAWRHKAGHHYDGERNCGCPGREGKMT